jgi:1,4-alpha-glucan branching enzyme
MNALKPLWEERRTMSFLSDFDLHLLAEGNHYRSYERLGAHVVAQEGATGTAFAVWAPAAAQVSVIGEFNGWDPAANPLAPRGYSGVWETFVPAIGTGTLYKYRITAGDGSLVDKADPYAFAAERPPGTASRVFELAGYAWGDQQWMAGRGRTSTLSAPLSIYEVHIGSWMRQAEEENRWLTYGELASRLADYVTELGYTHVELLPVSEYPFDGSWGYQPVGLFAPTARYGTPHDFMALIDTLHRRGLGVILDWVPAHFARDAHGLGRYDGTPLYEHPDPVRGQNLDWGTYVFNFGRPEVANFLISNALYWLDLYHIDAIRVDAVASMLYLQPTRDRRTATGISPQPESNDDAIAFLRRFNDQVHLEFPDVLTIAEESTAWPNVTRPPGTGGLGFNLKWDLGWMHDTLAYMAHPPSQRRQAHHQLTFRMIYAFSENYVLPLSHDDVSTAKGSLLSRMPGDSWQKFANLRLLYGYMYAQPGKKLLFMGCEFGQPDAWNHDHGLSWQVLRDSKHKGLARWVRDLNTLYRGTPALHELDCEPDGFAWIDCNDAQNSVLCMLRKGRTSKDLVLLVCNFTPTPQHNYRVGVPRNGHWEEILNGDASLYGGSGQGNIGGAQATPVHWHGQAQSLNLTLPPLAMIALRSPG